jgi:hypothetical protein
MAHRERHTRTGLEIAFERQRAAFVGEFHHHIDDPGSAGSGVRAVAGVVRVKPYGEI